LLITARPSCQDFAREIMRRCFICIFSAFSSRLIHAGRHYWNGNLSESDQGRKFVFMKGDLCQHDLADEINRLRQTQAALLEAMQEHQVTLRQSLSFSLNIFCAGDTKSIEMEGTYPLPEASSIASC